mmetsp:Transcript_113058/g.365363  ORF Transcript_113058/g.365363 Transcript_113058/m.365363 type:complete len:355 (-) Transcript_113058:72-1136(-)
MADRPMATTSTAAQGSRGQGSRICRRPSTPWAPGRTAEECSMTTTRRNRPAGWRPGRRLRGCACRPGRGMRCGTPSRWTKRRQKLASRALSPEPPPPQPPRVPTRATPKAATPTAPPVSMSPATATPGAPRRPHLAAPASSRRQQGRLRRRVLQRLQQLLRRAAPMGFLLQQQPQLRRVGPAPSRRGPRIGNRTTRQKQESETEQPEEPRSGAARRTATMALRRPAPLPERAPRLRPPPPEEADVRSSRSRGPPSVGVATVARCRADVATWAAIEPPTSMFKTTHFKSAKRWLGCWAPLHHTVAADCHRIATSTAAGVRWGTRLWALLSQPFEKRKQRAATLVAQLSFHSCSML